MQTIDKNAMYFAGPEENRTMRSVTRGPVSRVTLNDYFVSVPTATNIGQPSGLGGPLKWNRQIVEPASGPDVVKAILQTTNRSTFMTGAIVIALSPAAGSVDWPAAVTDVVPCGYPSRITVHASDDEMLYGETVYDKRQADALRRVAAEKRPLLGKALSL